MDDEVVAPARVRGDGQHRGRDGDAVGAHGLGGRGHGRLRRFLHGLHGLVGHGQALLRC
jgi:hypothetical protein